MRDTSWKNTRAGVVKFSDNASAFTSEHLKCGWILLSNCSLGQLRIPIVLLRPDGGVALFELPPAWTEDLPARFRQGLARAGFTDAYPGHLPVIHRRLRPEDIPHLDSILHEAFAFEDGIGLSPASGWAEKLQAMLAVAPAKPPMPPVPVPRTRALRQALLPALLACGVAAGWLLWPAAHQAEPPPALPRLAATPPTIPAPAEAPATPLPAPQTESLWPRWTASALAGAPDMESPPVTPAPTTLSALPDMEAVPAVPEGDTLAGAMAPPAALPAVVEEGLPQAPMPALVTLAALQAPLGWDMPMAGAAPPALLATDPVPLLPEAMSAPDTPTIAPPPGPTIARWLIPEFVQAETPTAAQVLAVELPDPAAPPPLALAGPQAGTEGLAPPARDSASAAARTHGVEAPGPGVAETPASPGPEQPVPMTAERPRLPEDRPPPGTTVAAEAPLPPLAERLAAERPTQALPLPAVGVPPAAMGSAAPAPSPAAEDASPPPSAAGAIATKAPPPERPMPRAASGAAASAGMTTAPMPARPLQEPATSPQPAVAEPALVSTMLRRAEVLLSFGDISGARRFLERAEAAGSASAAVALAETYDPATLASLHTRGLQPDPAAALAWYRRAAARGAPVAQRIQALEAP